MRQTTRQRCLSGLLLVMGGSLRVQAVQLAAVAPAPLLAKVAFAPNVCVAVHRGDVLVLNWNPGFEHPAMVAGLRHLSLVFAGLADNGVTLQRAPAFTLGDALHPAVTTDGGNGIFHTETTVGRTLPLGEFHLVAASAVPRMDPRFAGDLPAMTVSPVAEHLCVTVLVSVRP